MQVILPRAVVAPLGCRRYVSRQQYLPPNATSSLVAKGRTLDAKKRQCLKFRM